MRWIAMLTCLLAFSSPLFASDAATEPDAGMELAYSPNWPEPPDTSAMLLRLGVGTVVTIGLCVGTLVLGRRWLTKVTPQNSARQLQIEESVTLGHRATLFLVKVGESRLIAGADASGLKSLIVLPTTFGDVLDQQVAEPSLTALASESPPVLAFPANVPRVA